ncbi:MAG: hypothetical protein ACO3AD_15410, partial [Burkholderiaceae bacterium]
MIFMALLYHCRVSARTTGNRLESANGETPGCGRRTQRLQSLEYQAEQRVVASLDLFIEIGLLLGG